MCLLKWCLSLDNAVFSREVSIKKRNAHPCLLYSVNFRFHVLRCGRCSSNNNTNNTSQVLLAGSSKSSTWKWWTTIVKISGGRHIRNDTFLCSKELTLIMFYSLTLNSLRTIFFVWQFILWFIYALYWKYEAPFNNKLIWGHFSLFWEE